MARNHNPLQNRTPIRRLRAEQYLLITLLSFAASVSVTRLFLELTGYPQIGGGELHIAHVLWGGLILFAASLLPLIFANRWALSWSAVLAGVGVGLFIDEVGKFITRTNDYFYPSAAPIIYALFLLTVLVYVVVRRPRRSDPRSQLYLVLQEMEEVLDRDLSPEERIWMLKYLDNVADQDNDPDLAQLARNLHEYLHSRKAKIVENEPPFFERLENRWLAFEAKWLPRLRLRFILAGALTAWAAYQLYIAVSVLLTFNNPTRAQALLNNLIHNQLIRNASGLNWFEAHVALEGSLGLVFLLCAILLAAGRDRPGIMIAIFSMLVTLTVVNLLLFYFDQFATIFNAVIQVLVLLLLIRYRDRFLRQTALPPN